MEPLFLDLVDILMIHKRQIERYGGDSGIRNKHLLESAIAQPFASFGGEYLHKDIYEMAAAYLFHLCGNHPFVDGNKRTAGAAAVVFLKANGIELNLEQEKFFRLVMDVASGKIDKREVAECFRVNIRTTPL
jgi:death on curing protein